MTTQQWDFGRVNVCCIYELEERLGIGAFLRSTDEGFTYFLAHRSVHRYTSLTDGAESLAPAELEFRLHIGHVAEPTVNRHGGAVDIGLEAIPPSFMLDLHPRNSIPLLSVLVVCVCAAQEFGSWQDTP